MVMKNQNTPKIELRPAVEADYGEVARFWLRMAAEINHWHPALLDDSRQIPGNYVPEKGGCILVPESGGILAGTLSLKRLAGDCGDLKRFFVRPGFRGARIGRRLIHAAAGQAAAFGYQRLVLDTYPR